MSFSRAGLSVALAIVLSIGIVGVQGQSAPASLLFDMGDLFAKGPDELANGTAAADAPCGTAMGAQQTTATAQFKLKTLPFAGMYHIAKQIPWSVKVQGASATGYSVRAELLGAATAIPPSIAQNTGLANPNTPVTISGTFAVNETNFQVHSGDGITFKVTVSPGPPPQGPTAPPAPSGQIVCGAGTKLTGVQLIRGMPGNGDLDEDGIPDCGSQTPPCTDEDTDKDGDNATNSAEVAAFTTPNTAKGPVKCQELNPRADSDPRIKPGTNDADNDGKTDQEECAAGYNPLSASSVPPRPRTLMDILLPIIIVLLILGILAALVFVFLKFGKTVSVTVLSTPELFVPAGTKGKYEIGVQNLSKKGEPRTYQLVVAGMPEGWDAKLSVDHVTLDPQGGANNQGRVWLEVESPVHTDPESAVVSVKAVPLNKAGRKDTMKLPGRASTITSINLPPGSKVPVKRGGKVTAAKAKDEAPAPDAPAGGNNDNLPVIAIEGVGETFAPKLEKAGIRTVGELRTADPTMVAKKTGAPPATVASWQQMAELMQLDGVGPQFAEQLVRTGVTSIPQLADQKPKDLVAQIEKTNAARATPIQGAGIQDKQAKNFVKAAQRWMKDHPAAAPAVAATPAAAASAPAAPAAAAPSAPAPAAKPQLQVGGLKHDPPAFRQGETVKSSVSVSNNGKEKSTIKLSLYVNDGLADVQTVTVKPGKAQDVQFKWTAQEKNKLNIRGELVSQ